MAKPTPRGDIASYERARFEYDGVAHDVYRKGQGPAVIVIPEMPGASPQLFGFADRVVAIGCSVVVPHLFGPANVDVTTLPVPLRALAHLRSVTQVCVSREFNVFASGRSSPVTHWLRGLAAHEHDRCGGPGVGVVGMCFTGGFALALASDPRVLAPVLSQPSLPVGGSPRSIDCDKLTLAAVAQRCAKEDLEVLGLRFKRDALSPYPRFQLLRDKLGDGFVAVEIEQRDGNPKGPYPLRHSVLTVDAVDEPNTPTYRALEQVLDLFKRKLLR
jgi:dienelactone hydrolase